MTIHCRTAQMGHSGKADWEWARRAQEVVKIPVIVNGDVCSAEDAQRAMDQTHCAGVMIGRRSIEYPWVFREAHAWLVNPLERTLEVQKRDLDAAREESNRRFSGLEQKARQEKEKAQQAPPPLDPTTAYETAARDLQSGRFDKAVDGYLQLIQQFPKHPKMEDVQFGLGEAYYGKRDFKLALAEYSRFYQDFAAGERAPEALFRLAKCYEELGNYQTAVLSLKVIVKKFKKSSFAKDAKKLIKQLSKNL